MRFVPNSDQLDRDYIERLVNKMFYGYIARATGIEYDEVVKTLYRLSQKGYPVYTMDKDELCELIKNTEL